MLNKMFKWLKYWRAYFRIPKGDYCDGCPYWVPNYDDIEIGDRTIAYCKYLKKSDVDIWEERKDNIWTEQISGKKTKGEDLPPSFSTLLWDGCKECGIKMGYEDK